MTDGDVLHGVPRMTLTHAPTPLTHAPRLSAAIGVDVWIKRDDVGALGLAGVADGQRTTILSKLFQLPRASNRPYG